MRSSMFSVSNRAKLSRPPGSGGGTEDLRNFGCEESLDVDPYRGAEMVDDPGQG